MPRGSFLQTVLAARVLHLGAAVAPLIRAHARLPGPVAAGPARGYKVHLASPATW